MKASPLTLVLNIKGREDFLKLKAKLEHMQGAPPDQNPSLLALDRLGIVHFARFVFIGEDRIAVITDFDGTIDEYAAAFADEMGPTFDLLLEHVTDHPRLPVKDNQHEFLAFVKLNDLKCIEPFYSAYPELGVQDILTLAETDEGKKLAASPFSEKASPLTLVMDIKSRDDFGILRQKLEKMQAAPPEQNPSRTALDRLGIVHYARFVFIGEANVAVITSFDGTMEKYVSAFANEMGDTFDLLLEHVTDHPPLPVKDNQAEFLAFVQKYDLKCIEPFYSAYPKLSVQDVLTLQASC